MATNLSRLLQKRYDEEQANKTKKTDENGSFEDIFVDDFVDDFSDDFVIENNVNAQEEKYEVVGKVILSRDSIMSEFKNNDNDMEVLESDDLIVDDIPIDSSFLNNIQKQIVKSNKLKQLKGEFTKKSNKKDSNSNPIDDHIKLLIKQVLVEDFLPLLKKELSLLKKQLK